MEIISHAHRARPIGEALTRAFDTAAASFRSGKGVAAGGWNDGSSSWRCSRVPRAGAQQAGNHSRHTRRAKIETPGSGLSGRNWI